MIYLAYRVSTHYHYGESASETHKHLIDADVDLQALIERVNEHFALPSTIRGERGTKHEIPLLSMHSVPTYMPGGGGTDYTAHIEIRESPTLAKTHRAREAALYGRKDSNGAFKPGQKFGKWVPVTSAMAATYSTRDNYQVEPLVKEKPAKARPRQVQ